MFWIVLLLAGFFTSSAYGVKGHWETYEMIDGLPSADVYSVCQDRDGNLWFGTHQGASRYNGESFHNYSIKDGLAHNQVLAVIEDSDGNLWFGTNGGGVSRFDGESFENYSVKEGLAGNTVHSILEDRSGDLWFGTSGGVSRFDGAASENLRTDDGLLSNVVNAILEDRKGILWFGTSAGISRYNGETFGHFTMADGLVDNSIFTILQDRDGDLWFGTSQGISRFDGREFQNFTTEHGLAHNDVRAICQDEEGDLWFGTFGGGVSEYDGNRFRNYTVKDGLADDRVLSVFLDREGNLWFTTYGGGVSRYNRDFQTFTTEDGLPENSIISLFDARDGALWTGHGGAVKPGKGACRYDGVEFQTFTRRDGLADDSVYAIAEDHKGNLWFGTGEGVSRFDGARFQTFTKEDDLAHNIVRVIAVDRNGSLWFGTERGVIEFDGEKFIPPVPFPLLERSIRFHPSEPDGYRALLTSQLVAQGHFIQTGETLSLSDNDSYEVEFEGSFVFPFFGRPYTSVFVNSDGNLTFGAPDAASTARDFKRFLEGPPRIAALFNDLNPAAGGRILISQSEKRVSILYDAVPDFRTNRPDTFQVSLFSDGQIEIAFSGEISFRGGIVGISPGNTTTLHQVDYRADLPKNVPTGAIAGDVRGFTHTATRDILEDSGGNFWFTTYGDGIYKYDGSVLIHFTTEEGLTDNRARCVLEDEKKRLWFGTQNGVSVFEDGRFRTVLEANYVRDILQDRDGDLWFATNGNGVFKYDGVNSQHITTRDGLADNLVRELLEDSKGNLWFGTNNGLTKYTPPKSKILPLVRITQIIADEAYEGVREISFPSSTKQIVIEYKGTSFKTRFSDIRYTYKLEGVDSDWSTGTESRRVFYRDLKPGTYQFLVRAIDRDLNYSDPPASLDIAVMAPPFHKSTLFIILLVAGVFFIPSVVYASILTAQRRKAKAEFEPIPNPYIVGNPIRSKEMFFGREDDFRFVQAKLGAGEAGLVIVFAGERRSGKTSILFQILNGRLGEQFVPALLDMQAMAVDSEAEFLERMALGINESLLQAGINPAPTDTEFREGNSITDLREGNPIRTFERLIAETMESLDGKALLLMLDEYELIETKIDDGVLRPDLITFFASLLEAHPRLSLIFTGSRHLEQRNVTYWRVLIGKSLYRRISFLSDRDALRLITEPVEDRVIYPRGIPERIVRLTAGQPFYTQVVCQNLMDRLNEVQRNRVRQEDVDAVAQELADNPLPQMIYFWDGLEQEQQSALSFLGEVLEDSDRYASARMLADFAREQDLVGALNLTPLPELERVLDELFVREVLERERAGEGQYEYRFRADLFRLWARQAHSVWQQVSDSDKD
jgi:ligand-binding sensor domain-containing protein